MPQDVSPKQIKLSPAMGQALQKALAAINGARAELQAAQAKLQALDSAYSPIIKALVVDAGFTIPEFVNHGIWEGEGTGPEDEQGVFYLRAR